MPPLFRIDAAKEVYYALDEKEKDNIVKNIRKTNTKVKIDIQRFKGLGEMNPSQLRETVMQPQSRRLIQLTLNASENTNSMFDLCFQKRAPDRKAWLEKKEFSRSVMTKEKLSTLSIKDYAENAYLNYSMYVILDQEELTQCELTVSNRFKKNFICHVKPGSRCNGKV